MQIVFKLEIVFLNHYAPNHLLVQEDGAILAILVTTHPPGSADQIWSSYL